MRARTWGSSCDNGSYPSKLVERAAADRASRNRADVGNEELSQDSELPMLIDQAVQEFLAELEYADRSRHTMRAYASDLATRRAGGRARADHSSGPAPACGGAKPPQPGHPRPPPSGALKLL